MSTLYIKDYRKFKLKFCKKIFLQWIREESRITVSSYEYLRIFIFLWIKLKTRSLNGNLFTLRTFCVSSNFPNECAKFAIKLSAILLGKYKHAIIL